MKLYQPTVYIGIVTYNSEKLISSCIASLLKQRHVSVRIIVFDNNSQDRVADVVRKFGASVTFIQSRTNLGFGGGHNAILRSLALRDIDYYMALNPDALPEPNCIAALVGASQRHNAAWTTGKLYKDKQRKIIYSVGHALCKDGYAFNIGHGLVDRGQYSKPREVFGAPGAAALYQGLMVKKLSVNGDFFDPKLFMYYEDIDVDWRARLYGLQCWYEPTAVVNHPGGDFPWQLEAEVLANRFLSIYKNALIGDLVFYNTPNIAVHVLFRIVVTPKIGAKILWKLFFVAPYALANRLPARVSKREIHRWFISASLEESQQRLTFVGRLQSFCRRLLHA